MMRRLSVWRGGIVAAWIVVLLLAGCGPDLALIDTSNDLYINAIALTGQGTGWAVGLEPGKKQSILLQEMHGTWQIASDAPKFTQGEAIKSLAVQGTTLLIAGSLTDAAHGDATQVSGFAYLRGTDGTWQRTTLGQSVNAAVLISAHEAWGVGAGGAIYHGVDGKWNQSPNEMSNDLLGVAFRAPDDGWAVGDQGVFIHYDGHVWRHIEHFTHETIYSVALSATDGWAVGTGGTTIRLGSDGKWFEVTTPIITTNRAVTIVANNAWLVGDHGAVFEYADADQQWHHIAPPEDLQLNALALAPDGTLLVGGNASQIHLFSYAQGNWATITLASAAK